MTHQEKAQEMGAMIADNHTLVFPTLVDAVWFEQWMIRRSEGHLCERNGQTVVLIAAWQKAAFDAARTAQAAPFGWAPAPQWAKDAKTTDERRN